MISDEIYNKAAKSLAIAVLEKDLDSKRYALEMKRNYRNSNGKVIIDFWCDIANINPEWLMDMISEKYEE
jgi:hypothetical protein